MRRWMRIGVWSALPIVASVLSAATAFAYLSWRSTSDAAFHFLAGRELVHQSTHETSSGREMVAVYCFFAYREAVCDAAGKELRALGYTEITPAVDYCSSDSRNRRGTSVFLKWGPRSAQILIGTGRFLEERPDGNLSFSDEADWVNVVIRQTRPRFSPYQELRYWWDRISGRKPPQRVTSITVQP